MASVFKALADPTRRRLLDRLHADNGQTLNALCEDLAITRQGITQHLEVLEAAGLVTTIRRGREKLHYLNPVPLHEVYERWIAKFEQPDLEALSGLKHQLEQETNTMEKPKLVYVTFIASTPERVWEALTDPDQTADVLGPPQRVRRGRRATAGSTCGSTAVASTVAARSSRSIRPGASSTPGERSRTPTTPSALTRDVTTSSPSTDVVKPHHHPREPDARAVRRALSKDGRSCSRASSPTSRPAHRSTAAIAHRHRKGPSAVVTSPRVRPSGAARARVRAVP